MSKLLVLGHSPLPTEPQKIQCAGNLRTWHFVKPLLEDGHEIRLIGARIHDSYPAGADAEIEKVDPGLHYLSLAPELFHDAAYLQAQHDAFEPDAIVGINTYPSSRAAVLTTNSPIWCDLNGWIMAEAQTKSATYDDDSYLSHFWNLERAVLDRADVISCVSKAQAMATIGELAVHGRLSRRTVGYEFTRHIPNALSEADYDHHFRVFRGTVVPEDAFVLLWVGGYNTWTDVDLLYSALETAMSQRENIHFVSTGGALVGHDDLTFERFRELTAQSKFRERIHFVGWVPTEHVPSYYHEADLGLNVDNRNYETLFGARNRLNDMLKVGLPILTTLGTEISFDLAKRNLALTCPIGDRDGFGKQILEAYSHPQRLAEMAERGRTFGVEQYSYRATTEPLLEWAKSPSRAPDLGARIPFDQSIDFFTGDTVPDEDASQVDVTGEQTASAANAAKYLVLEAELEEIHSSKMWRLWMVYCRLRRRLSGS